MTAEAGWRLALDRAGSSQVALIIGRTDTGKTSLATYLASRLAERNFKVGVVDADLGQSALGPPTTLGLGRVSRPLSSLGEAELLALHWVGSTSPPGFERALSAGTRRLVDRALALDLRPVLVDTCGLVDGELGRFLKLEKIRRVDPDLVICLEHEGECEPILEPLLEWGRPGVLRLPATAGARRRSTAERRRRREETLEAYFAGALARSVPLARLSPGPDGETGPHATGKLEDVLVGLHDALDETLGIGRIASMDHALGTLVVETPVTEVLIARVSPGRERFRPAASAR